jgi:hypothetical protein
VPGIWPLEKSACRAEKASILAAARRKWPLFWPFREKRAFTRKIRRLEAQHQKNDRDHINRHSLKPPKT